MKENIILFFCIYLWAFLVAGYHRSILFAVHDDHQYDMAYGYYTNNKKETLYKNECLECIIFVFLFFVLNGKAQY